MLVEFGMGHRMEIVVVIVHKLCAFLFCLRHQSLLKSWFNTDLMCLTKTEVFDSVVVHMNDQFFRTFKCNDL